MSGSYVEVSIRAEDFLIEHLTGLLTQLGFEGFWEDGETLRCYMKKQRWNTELQREIEETIRYTFRSHRSPSPHISVNFPEDRNWNEAWEKTITPIQVTRRIIITPSWHDVQPEPDQIVLTIDPKMSFGTGYHESTRLCLRLLEEYVTSGMSVLDVGTGTGVLAIAAVKLGAANAVGLDTDSWAFSNARENVVRNHLDGQIRILEGELRVAENSDFDIVIANIQRDVIELILTEMLERMKRRGLLILSGLLTSDFPLLQPRLEKENLEILKSLTENEWLAMTCRRRVPGAHATGSDQVTTP